MRDGRVPKFKKNLEKMQERAIEAQKKREGWHIEQEKKQREVERQKQSVRDAARPLKINAAAFGTGIAQNKAKGAAPGAKSNHNIKF